jgi:hypothetical protein
MTQLHRHILRSADWQHRRTDLLMPGEYRLDAFIGCIEYAIADLLLPQQKLNLKLTITHHKLLRRGELHGQRIIDQAAYNIV